MKAEAIKAYRVPIDNPPTDLRESIGGDTEAHQALEKGKLHLRFGKEERKKLRDGLLKDWKYAKHYVDSAINSVIGLVKGWISLYNGGRAKSEPEITRKTVYVKTTLFSVKNGKIKITIVPRKRYLEIDLTRFDYLPKDHDAIDGLLLTEDCLIITFKRKVELVEPKDYAAFDVNLKNITGFINGKIVKYDLRELYHIHRVYEEKRRKIQKLSKSKPKTAKRLMEKYSKRERNRVKDFMHKLTTTIARKLASLKCGAILEDLRNIKDRILNGSRDLNRKLSKWNARTFQFMLEYKLRWFGLPVKYVNPRNSSKTCPLCSGRMATYAGRSMRCKKCGLILDRDVVAVLNLRMWGLGVAPKGGEPERGDAPQSGCLLTNADIR